MKYNRNSNSDKEEDVDFVDVDLPCNKPSVQLLVNDSITYSKKKRGVIDVNNELDKLSKAKTAQQKNTLVKHIGKKSSKAFMPISGLIGYSLLNIQAFFMNTNVVIPALDLFQILLKFRKEIRRLITVPWKPCKKKVISPTIPVVDNKNELYAEADYSNQNLINTNYTLFKTLK